jgi:hypothetical protein
MATSLKAALPVFAKPFGLTPVAVYERQLALVRAGLLPMRGGRGPGSGVPLTPDTAATMLIALLTSDAIDAAARVRTVSALKHVVGGEPYDRPVASKPTFGAALAEVLASKELAASVSLIGVERTAPTAAIFGAGPMASFFAPRGKADYLMPTKRALVFVEVNLSGDVVRAIANAVTE